MIPMDSNYRAERRERAEERKRAKKKILTDAAIYKIMEQRMEQPTADVISKHISSYLC